MKRGTYASAEETAASQLMRARMKQLCGADDRWQRLWERMEALGVKVSIGLLPSGYRGWYDHADRRITLDVLLTPSELLSTFAHEVGHATLGHDSEGVAFFERAADRWAAHFLIADAAWEQHLAVSSSTPWLAACFGVQEYVVEAKRGNYRSRGM